jgi:hypothetical protein
MDEKEEQKEEGWHKTQWERGRGTIWIFGIHLYNLFFP